VADEAVTNCFHHVSIFQIWRHLQDEVWVFASLGDGMHKLCEYRLVIEDIPDFFDILQSFPEAANELGW
jgi:hypothetical protein